MVDTRRDGGPAFPIADVGEDSYGVVRTRAVSVGMSLRDYFAGQFLASVRIDGAVEGNTIATNCYAMADAMLRAREGK
jgi:hypothetical protein